jgi:hypothetical protein
VSTTRARQAGSTRAVARSIDMDAHRLCFCTHAQQQVVAAMIDGCAVLRAAAAAGGLTFAPHTLEAAQLGALAALPLAAASLLSRTQHVRQAIPLLEDLHIAQQELLLPLIQGMCSQWHPWWSLSACLVLPG